MTRHKERRHNLIVPLLIILCLMIVMQLYTSRLINSVAVSNIQEVGEDRLSGVVAQLNNYLERTTSVLWVTADTVDYMVRNGLPTDQILQYIMEETQRQSQKFDDNYTGFYGFINGEYLDGLGWVPPDGYNPVERDWYKKAVLAGGETVIVPPYVDAQTQDVVISICRRLSDEANVVALDVKMNHIQKLMEELQIKGKGYGFIVDSTGMIIAHRDPSKKGDYLTETREQRSFLGRIWRMDKGSFEVELDGRKNTVFVNQIMNQWSVVIVVSNHELYAEVWQQLAVNIVICSVIFILIAFFYFLGYRNEQIYSRQMEELVMEEQQQAYETKMLKLAKEAADQSNKAKSDFLAEMSHEIRTPINAVLGMNEMILRESSEAMDRTPDERQAAAFGSIRLYASNIESAGNNLLSIINDILDFSKIEAGKLEIAEGEYQLSSVLNDVSNLIAFRARSKGLEFNVDVDDTLPNGLFGDEVRVRQIITNILSNAVKYTNTGSVKLSVRGDNETVSGEGGHIDLIVSVQDTGIGIREQDMGRLFDKFERVDLNRNSTIEGTGLGLAITRRLLAMMGGSISVDSVYGKGSTFTVSIPQGIVSREPLGNFRERFEKSIHQSRAHSESFHAPNAHILIVDDTRMNLAVVTGLLKNTQIKADTADSGAEAVKRAQMVCYDLILMDQRMPEMDGTEAMRHIRKSGLNQQTPVICLTADAVSGAREKYIAAGFTDYLTKPIDAGSLEKILIRYLPAAKIERVQPEQRLETAESVTEAFARGDEEAFAPLRAAGIAPETGLLCCEGDAELYRSLLLEYSQSAQENTKGLESYRTTRDWKSYGILAHSLKSTSRMIGATCLSDIAQRLEAAADRGDEAIIDGEHADMLAQYDAVVHGIRQLLGEHAETADDVDILEFIPEEE